MKFLIALLRSSGLMLIFVGFCSIATLTLADFPPNDPNCPVIGVVCCEICRSCTFDEGNPFTTEDDSCSGSCSQSNPSCGGCTGACYDSPERVFNNGTLEYEYVCACVGEVL